MNESSETSTLLKRPEAVILILFATLFVIWDAYLSLLDLDEVDSTALSSRQLAQRLGTTPKILRLRKRQPNFGEWTQQLDPDGMAWEYAGGVYVPRA